MDRRLPLVVAALLAAPALFAVACGARPALDVDDAEIETDAGAEHDASLDAPPPDAGPACAADGDPCDLPSACCSGACTAGTCALGIESCTVGAPPVVLAAGTPADSYGLAVDDTDVYWTSSTGEIQRVPKGGGVPVVLAQSAFPRGVALDGTHVYWTADEGVQRAPKAGGPAVLLSSSSGIPWFLALDSQFVYWTDHFGGSVRRVAKDGSDTSAVLATGTTTFGITAAGDKVFFGDNDEGMVLAVPKLGGSPTVLSTSETPWALAVDDRLYWSVACGPMCGALKGVSKSGGTSVDVATGLNQPLGIAVDATHVYWGEWAESKAIRKAAKDGTDVVTVASGVPQVAALAVDASCVYWVDGNGTVSKVHK